MDDMPELRQRLEQLKYDPPQVDDTPGTFGNKLLKLAEIQLELCEQMLKANQDDAR